MRPSNVNVCMLNPKQFSFPCIASSWCLCEHNAAGDSCTLSPPLAVCLSVSPRGEHPQCDGGWNAEKRSAATSGRHTGPSGARNMKAGAYKARNHLMSVFARDLTGRPVPSVVKAKRIVSSYLGRLINKITLPWLLQTYLLNDSPAKCQEISFDNVLWIQSPGVTLFFSSTAALILPQCHSYSQSANAFSLLFSSIHKGFLKILPMH